MVYIKAWLVCQYIRVDAAGCLSEAAVDAAGSLEAATVAKVGGVFGL